MVAVSVLIRTIGRQGALKDALDSLKAQTFRDFETVVVEDGPATLSAFLSVYKDLSLRYGALGSNKGRSVAGNRALALAQGEYCLFLDEDDTLYPEHLQLLVQGLRDTRRLIAYSWSQERAVERNTEGAIIRRSRLRHTRRERFSLLHLVAANFVPINAVLFSRSLFTRAGGFDEDIDCLEDWLLWLRYATLEPDWLCVERATAIYHIPFDNTPRRRAFYAAQAKVKERMQIIAAAWPLETLHRDLNVHFRIAIFLRKLYYFLTGYV